MHQPPGAFAIATVGMKPLGITARTRHSRLPHRILWNAETEECLANQASQIDVGAARVGGCCPAEAAEALAKELLERFEYRRVDLVATGTDVGPDRGPDGPG